MESIKKRQLKDGPPTGNDRVILATAVKLAERYDVEILTFDHDFIVFSDEIKSVQCRYSQCWNDTVLRSFHG